jgi:hypothetical protein
MASVDPRKARGDLKSVYPGDQWSKKVDKMTDAQVIAVYLRFKEQEKL